MQFIAWDVSKKAARPVGTVRAALADVFTAKVEEDPVDLIIPFPTGRNLFSWLPGTSYLATFIQSLQGQILSTNWPRIRRQIIVKLSADRRSVANALGKKHVFEDEDDDEGRGRFFFTTALRSVSLYLRAISPERLDQRIPRSHGAVVTPKDNVAEHRIDI